MTMKFKFKGDRDYVHGTDMINSYLSTKKGINSMSVQIRKMTSKNLKITNGDGAANQSVVAEFVFSNNDRGKVEEYLIETTEDASGRYEYDEDELVSVSQIDMDNFSIFMKANKRYSFIENVVAMHKKLVIETVSSNVKWLFVGLDLKEIPELKNNDHLSLKINKRLGTKLIQSEIKLNDASIGQIKFSSIKKDN